jgi:hypothetical protein
MENFSKVCAIILNYNGRNCVFNAVASIFRSDYPNFEVIMVDNGSTDGSFEQIKKSFSRVICIKNEHNLGYAAGNNIGIEYALERGAQYIWLLNNDIKVESRTLPELIRLMKSDKKIGLVSPLIFFGDSGNVWFSGGKISWLRMKTLHLKRTLKENYFGSGYLTGCAILIRAEVFQKIGLLDEKYFLYFEDADFSVRAKAAGYKLAVSSAGQIRHYEKSAGKPESKIYWLVISGLIFFAQHTPIYFKPWISAYFLARKIKNRFDSKWRQNNSAQAVAKAYKDYKHAR